MQSQAVAALSDPGYTTAVAKIDWYSLLGEQVRLIGTPVVGAVLLIAALIFLIVALVRGMKPHGPLVRRRCRQRGIADRNGTALSAERTTTDASARGSADGPIE